jgi:hypothetical protein
MCLYVFVAFGVANADGWSHKSLTKFEPSVGDYFLVDINNGIGYLINDENKTYLIFPVMTGSLRAPTPEKEWVVKEKNIQPNRIIFSESGEFLRMYMDGETRTGYGIHGYAYFEKEIKEGTKFLSLGCVLVADDVLDVIEESYLANGESLKMSTVKEVNISSYLAVLKKD